jgi:hypothetical protein
VELRFKPLFRSNQIVGAYGKEDSLNKLKFKDAIKIFEFKKLFGVESRDNLDLL